MPRVRRKAKKYRSRVTDRLRWVLLTGGDYWFLSTPEEKEFWKFFPEEYIKAAWEEYREVLLEEFIRETPDKRPWAWWRYDAPELRRRIDGKPHPFDELSSESTSEGCPEDDSRLCKEDYDVSFGVPSSSLDPDDPNEVYESEGEYLERLGLK